MPTPLNKFSISVGLLDGFLILGVALLLIIYDEGYTTRWERFVGFLWPYLLRDLLPLAFFIGWRGKLDAEALAKSDSSVVRQSDVQLSDLLIFKIVVW